MLVVSRFRLVGAFTLALVVILQTNSGATQSRPLTAGDFPKQGPLTPAAAATLRGVTGAALAERVVLASDEGATLRLALSLASPDFATGVKVEDLIATLTALRADSMKRLMPALLAPIEARDANRGQARGIGPAAGQMAAAFRSEPASWPWPAASLLPDHVVTDSSPAEIEWPTETGSSTVVNEYEMVVNGMTANVRDEVTMLSEGRHVGIRHVKRETVEQNGDPTAVGRYIVEQGTIEGGKFRSTATSPHARRLRPTSTHRMTTEVVREAKVERCPDAGGLTRGQTLISITIRSTAAANGTGAPAMVEIAARGTSTGRVNDMAKMAGFDWDVNAETKMQSLGSGEDFRLSESTHLATDGSGVTGTQGEVVASGVGNKETALKMLSAQRKADADGYGPLLFAYDSAEKEWRRGACVELTVASGAEPRPLKPGEARKLVVEARHRYDKEPPAIPVTAKPSGGSLIPGAPVRTPGATFTFTADPRGEGGGLVAFESTSRRGIAREINVSFDPVDEDALLIRYVYTGFKFVDSTAEDCPSMRPNGAEVLTARVRLLRTRGGSTFYGGTGRFSADIDACGLTPNRKDPGATGNGNGFGGFNGDNFLGCKVTTVAADREVLVTLELQVYEDLNNQPRSLEISWEPSGAPPDPRIASTCEGPWHAQYASDITREYRDEKRMEITDPDVLQRIATGRALREGNFADPDGTSEGRWTLTVTKAGTRQKMR